MAHAGGIYARHHRRARTPCPQGKNIIYSQRYCVRWRYYWSRAKHTAGAARATPVGCAQADGVLSAAAIPPHFMPPAISCRRQPVIITPTVKGKDAHLRTIGRDFRPRVTIQMDMRTVQQLPYSCRDGFDAPEPATPARQTLTDDDDRASD